MAIDSASRQTECRAKARNWSAELRQKCVGINTLSLWHLQIIIIIIIINVDVQGGIMTRKTLQGHLTNTKQSRVNRDAAQVLASFLAKGCPEEYCLQLPSKVHQWLFILILVAW